MHKALRVAAQVRAWVEQQPEGRVHSVFARACNLAWGDHLIALTMPEYGMVPGGVAVALTGEGGWGFLPGEPVFWDAAGQRLLGTRTGVDLAGAPLWANRCRVGSVASDGVLTARLAELASVVRQDGRGELARLLAAWPPAFPAEPADPTRWSSFAWAPLQALLQALTDGDAEAVPAGLRPVVGLGEGLTPSCDDFLVGLEAVLHYGRNLLGPRQVGYALRLGEEAARLARGTTPVSANYLRLAAGGGFSERLETVALALLAEEGGDFAAAARMLIETGHSSGTDSLVGLILGTIAILKGTK